MEDNTVLVFLSKRAHVSAAFAFIWETAIRSSAFSLVSSGWTWRMESRLWNTASKAEVSKTWSECQKVREDGETARHREHRIPRENPSS